MLICECASARKGGSKEEWIKQAVKCLEKWEIKGMFWFQAHKEVDWRFLWTEYPEANRALRKRLSCSLPWLKAITIE